LDGLGIHVGSGGARRTFHLRVSVGTPGVPRQHLHCLRNRVAWRANLHVIPSTAEIRNNSALFARRHRRTGWRFGRSADRRRREVDQLSGSRTDAAPGLAIAVGSHREIPESPDCPGLFCRLRKN
jgi:hypothetical protein